MKKLMATMVGAALVFAAAGQATASTLETKGEYRGRYWYLSDYAKGNPAVEDTNDFWDQRLRLNMAWQVSEGVKVGARADILENVWDTSKDAMEIDFDQAFAAFSLGGPTTVTVGKQDVTWGLGVYAKADNRYRAKIGTKFDKIAVSAAWDVLAETMDSPASDDDNGFTLGVTMPTGDWTWGLLGVYRKNDSAPGAEDTTYGVDFTGTGAIGGMKLAFEVAYAAGEIDSNTAIDIDKTGLMAYAGLTMPLGPVGLGFEFAYASGNDPGTLDENEGALFFDYNGPFSSFILFNNFDLDGWNSQFSGGADKGLNNAMAGKVSATFAANEKLSFMGAAVYAVADQTIANQDDDMGIEVDGLVKYMVTENVTAQAGLGYLAAGDFWGKDVDDPWVGTVQFIVAF